jgi:peptidoglycan/LPS O-acetylase OafA/YrhL
MFYTIDGLRGLAALLVVTRHIIPLHAGQLTTASSYLAVELFFLFSGFVIAHAYDRRFAEGLSFWTFAKVRVIRLYPLYLLAFAIAVLTVPAARMAGLKTWPLDPAVIIPGLLMLPTFARGAYGLVYPFNNPSWTLFFELTANAAYALIWRWLNNLALAVVIAASALGLAATALHFGSLDVGFSKAQFVGGFGRVFFSFFAGVGVYRLQLARPCPLKISPWLLLAGCFILLIAWPQKGAERTAYDMACALIVFPGFAYLSTAVEPGPLGQRLFSLGGGVSYALYLLHSPLGGALNQFFLVYGRPKGSAILGISFIASAAVFAWLAERCFDRPVRRWLTALTTPKAAPAR